MLLFPSELDKALKGLLLGSEWTFECVTQRIGRFHISLTMGVNGAEGVVTHEKSRYSAKRNRASRTNSEGGLFVLKLYSLRIASVVSST